MFVFVQHTKSDRFERSVLIVYTPGDVMFVNRAFAEVFMSKKKKKKYPILNARFIDVYTCVFRQPPYNLYILVTLYINIYIMRTYIYYHSTMVNKEIVQVL